LKKKPAGFKEELNDLKSERLSARPETEPSVLVNDLATPLVSEATTVNEPARVLKIEAWPAKPDPNPIEPSRDSTKPLVSTVMRESELVNDLNRDLCSARVGLVVHEPPRDREKPNFSAKAKTEDSDPENTLRIEVFSEKLDPEPMETDR